MPCAPALPRRPDADAERNRTAEDNAGLVWSQMARMRMCGRGDADDLFQAGMLALLRAAERYDPAGPARFGTYACAAVRRAILREAGRADAFASPPTCPGGPRRRASPLPAPAPDGGDMPPPADARAADPGAEAARRELRGHIEEALAKLHPHHAEIVRLRYLGGLTQSQVGGRLGVTQAAVSQMEEAALSELARRCAWLAEFLS